MLIWNSCEVPPDTDRKILLSIHNTERLIIAYYDTCNYCCYIDDGIIHTNTRTKWAEINYPINLES